MKKIIICIAIISILPSCQDSKISELEYRVKELESKDTHSSSKTDIKIDSLVGEYKKNLRVIQNL